MSAGAEVVVPGIRRAYRSELARVLSNITLPRMARQHQNQAVVIASPWILDALPVVVVVLIAAHLIALIYWIYRLVADKQAGRRKAH